MPTPEHQIQKIIDETVATMTGVLFEITAEVDPVDAGRVINAAQLDLFTDKMNTEILGVMTTGFVDEITKTVAVAPLSGAVMQSYIDVEGASFLAKLGDLSSIVKSEVTKGILTGAGRAEIAQAITGSGLRPDQVGTLVNTALTTFSRTIDVAMQNNTPESTKLIYTGPLDEKTRPICIEMLAAGPLTANEVDSQFPGARVDGGGFNCRHRWITRAATNINQESRANKIKSKLIAADKFGEPKTLRQIQSDANNN